MRIVAVVLALLAVTPAVARAQPTGRVTGTVKLIGPDGKPAAIDAVIVYVTGFDEPPPAGKTVALVQKDKKFVPDLLAVTAGQEVTFPNGDPVLHNVFSRSPTRAFDLGQYRQGESKAKSFPKPGVVDVYCNVHPEMAATIVVVPNRAHARVAKDGTFAIAGVPPGTWTVFAYTRLATQPARATVTVAAGADATVTLELRRGTAADHKNKFGERYRDPTRYR